jgi:hypothetical protein
LIVDHLEKTNATEDDYSEKYELCRVALTRTFKKREQRRSESTNENKLQAELKEIDYQLDWRD